MRYCTYCDTPIVNQKVDDIPCVYCNKCSRIEWGYEENEKELVGELREYLGKQRYYQIADLLIIFKKYFGSE